MSNYSYLCSSQQRTIYPGLSEPDYDSKQHTIACDVFALPLLWMGLFRESDIVKTEFKIDGDLIPAEAPVVASATAIDRLQRSLSYLNELFQEQGPLDSHVAALLEAIQSTGRPFVSLELEELAVIWDTGEDQFYTDLRSALKFIEQEQVSEEARNILVDFSSLRLSGNQFLTVDEFVAHGAVTEDEEWNFTRLLGAGLYRPVPWEPQPSDEESE